MAANDQDVKDAFALSGNKPVISDVQLAKMQIIVDVDLGISGSNASDLFDGMYEYFVKRWEARQLGRDQDAVSKSKF